MTITVSPARQPSAVIPIVMSLAALGAVAYHLVRFGTAAQPDEGAAAHIWQLLMAGQLPVIGFYTLKWLPRAPGPTLRMLALQVGAALAAVAPIYFLGW